MVPTSTETGGAGARVVLQSSFTSSTTDNEHNPQTSSSRDYVHNDPEAATAAHDETTAGLVHAHPVQPQDTSNIVEANPLDDTQSRKRPLQAYYYCCWAILLGICLAVVGVIVTVVVTTSAAEDSGGDSSSATSNSMSGSSPSLDTTAAPTTERMHWIRQQLIPDMGNPVVVL